MRIPVLALHGDCSSSGDEASPNRCRTWAGGYPNCHSPYERVVYLLFGISHVFTLVGLQELFYDQGPSELRSIGLALYLSIYGIGSFISSFLISVIENATGGEGEDSWFADNLNRAHLDYFYWLLAGLSAAAFIAYLYFTKSYIYNSKRVA